MYSKLPPEEKSLIYSKYVEDISGTNLKRKCISLVIITQIHHNCFNIRICVFVFTQNFPQLIYKQLNSIALINGNSKGLPIQTTKT